MCSPQAYTIPCNLSRLTNAAPRPLPPPLFYLSSTLEQAVFGHFKLPLFQKHLLCHVGRSRLCVYLERCTRTHTHAATRKQKATVVLPPVHNLACVCFPGFLHSVETFSSDETCIYLFFFLPLKPQPLKSNKRWSSILLPPSIKPHQEECR